MAEQVFVARERELAQLQTFLDLAVNGQGQICFVSGNAGTGKTSLVTRFAHLAQTSQQELLIAMGECNAQTGVGDPYLPFREVLRLLTGNVSVGALSEENASRLSGFLRVSGNAIAELGPDLIDIFVPGAGLVTRAAALVADRAGWLEKLEQLSSRNTQRSPALATADDVGLEQSHIFEQYTRVLQAMAAQQPLMLILDDLQWADADSISLLFYLCRQIRASRILIVGTYRPTDVALGRPVPGSGESQRHPLESALHELQRYFGDIQITLDEEDENFGRHFVAAFLDSEPNRLGESFRNRLFRHTRGQPLFTVELLRAMQERGDLRLDPDGYWTEGPHLDWETLPARVEGVIGERIQRLDPELQEALTIASLEGETFTAEVIARVQQLDVRRLVRRLSRELDRQHRLVQAEGVQRVGQQRLSRYEFRHILFQKYLSESLDEAEGSFLHEEIGLVLEEIYGDQTDEIAARLAFHFEKAGLAEKAHGYLIQAGMRARRNYANAEALALLSLALSQTPETDLATRYTILLERERVYNLQGARESQQQDLAALERMVDALNGAHTTLATMPAEWKTTVALRRAHFAEATGDFPAAIAAAQKAVALAQTAGHGETQAAGHLQWGRALWRQGHYAAATTQLEKAILLFRQHQDQRGECRALNSLGNVLADQDDHIGAMRIYEQALELCRENGDRLLESILLNNIGLVAQEQGHYATCTTFYEQALSMSRSIGDREGEGYLLTNLGLVTQYQGDYATAATCYEQALSIYREVDDRRSIGLLLCNLGLLCHQQGHHASARDYCEQALQITQEVGDQRTQGYVLTNLGHALAGLGRLAEAADAYQEALAQRQAMDQQVAAMESRAGLARLALIQKDLPQAQQWIEPILDHLSEQAHPSNSGHGLDGTEDPFRVYLTCYQVLRATQDPRAEQMLTTTYHLLQEQATKITDERLRQLFLENVPAHREIVRELTLSTGPALDR